jgi:hypothetical protein
VQPWVRLPQGHGRVVRATVFSAWWRPAPTGMNQRRRRVWQIRARECPLDVVIAVGDGDCTQASRGPVVAGQLPWLGPREPATTLTGRRQPGLGTAPRPHARGTGVRLPAPPCCGPAVFSEDATERHHSRRPRSRSGCRQAVGWGNWRRETGASGSRSRSIAVTSIAPTASSPATPARPHGATPRRPVPVRQGPGRPAAGVLVRWLLCRIRAAPAEAIACPQLGSVELPDYLMVFRRQWHGRPGARAARRRRGPSRGRRPHLIPYCWLSQ